MDLTYDLLVYMPFFARNETIRYRKTVTGHAHIQQSQTTARHASACGLLGPLRGASHTLQVYETIYTVDGERGGVHKKSVNA